jgi:uncharacterized protein (DUF3820 family)
MSGMNWDKMRGRKKINDAKKAGTLENVNGNLKSPNEEVPGVRLWLLNGKYFNKPVNDVPDSYLKWIKKNFDNGSYGHKMACNELDIRQCVKNIETRLEEIDKKS